MATPGGDNDEQLAKMLAAYYDVELEPEPVAPVVVEDEISGRDRSKSDFSLGKLGRLAQSALASGLQEIGLAKIAEEVAAPSKSEFKAERVDLNSAQFELSEYMQHKLRFKSLQELNIMRANVSDAVVEQDASMQSLVFTNYHKFVDATTTIRNLKSDVESTSKDMNGLFATIDEIGTRSSGIESRLAPHKSRVEQLVGVRRLLKRVEFLFELPARLTKSLELGAHAQAVRYHRVAAKLLAQLSNIKSFDAVRRDSDAIMQKLRDRLRVSVRDTRAGSIAQLECATLLLELGEDANSVWPALLDGRQAKMTDDLSRAARLAEQSDQQDAAEGGRSTGLALLHQHFMVEFLEFTEQFAGLFLDEHAIKRRASTVTFSDTVVKTDVAHAQTAQNVTMALTKMTRTLFVEYFRLAFQAFDRAAASALSVARQDPFAPFVEDVQNFYEHVRRAAQLVPGARLLDKAGEIVEKALRACVQCVFGEARRAIITALRQLHSRVVELVTQTHADSKPIEQPTSAATSAPATAGGASMAKRMEALRAQAKDNKKEEPKEASSISPPSSSAGIKSGANDNDDSRPLSDKETEKRESEALARLQRDLATGPGNQIVLQISDALHSLVPLLSDSQLSSIVDTPFAPLVHDAVRSAFSDFTALLLRDTVRLADGHVHSVRSLVQAVDLSAKDDEEAAAMLRWQQQQHQQQHKSRARSQSVVVPERSPPMFFIVLSQLCQFMVQRGVNNCLMFLHDAFPLDDQEQEDEDESAPADRAEADKKAILADMKEAANMLLRKYVELHGAAASDALIDSFAVSVGQSEPSKVSTQVVAFVRRARMIEAELAKLYPRDANAAASSSAAAPSKGSDSSSGGDAVLARVRTRTADKAMSRLFTQRIQIFGPILPSRAAPLGAVHRIVFKGLLESVRVSPVLSPTALRQVQVDVAALRCALSPQLPASEREALDSLLDDILASASDRCSEDMRAFDAALHARVRLVRDTPELLSAAGDAPNLL